MKNKIKKVLNNYFAGQTNIEEYENILEDEFVGMVKPNVYVVDDEDIEILSREIEKAVRKEMERGNKTK